jgi:CRP-like cAMP-binding protein
MFVITRGGVELFPPHQRPGTSTTVLARGDIFGESAALMELPRDHTVRS